MADIFVIDNGSTDKSLEILKESFPSVYRIELKENLGFAGGYNEGLKSIEHEYLVLLNSDVEVSENWIAPVVSYMQQHPKVSIAQPKILDQKRKEYFEYAGAAGGFIDKDGYPFCRGRIFDSLERDQGQYNDAGPIFWASGSAMFIKNEVYKSLGGFDESFFAHMEEIDLCWRAQIRGHEVHFVPDSKVYHVGGASLDKSNPKKTFYNFRNSLAMQMKNKAQRPGLTIGKRLILDGIAGIRFLFQGKLNHCIAIIEAHFSFYGQLSELKSKRDEIQSGETHAVQGLYDGSIVSDYYFKKKKKFSDLGI